MTATKQKKAPATRRSKARLSSEDVFLILVFVTCSAAGAFLAYFRENREPIVPALFLATGIASLVYRFLGGLGEGSGVSADGVASPLKIRLTGSIAALLGSALLIWLAMTQFDEPDQPPDFEPRQEQWLAVDRSGRPQRVRIRLPEAEEPGGATAQEGETRADFLRNARLEIERGEDDELLVTPENSEGFVLGRLEEKEVKKELESLFDTRLAAGESERTWNLPPYSPPQRLASLDAAERHAPARERRARRRGVGARQPPRLAYTVRREGGELRLYSLFYARFLIAEMEVETR